MPEIFDVDFSSIFWAIIVSLIGAAIYELALRPALSYSRKKTASKLSKRSKRYNDTIIQRAALQAESTYTYASFHISSIILMMCVLLCAYITAIYAKYFGFFYALSEEPSSPSRIDFYIPFLTYILCGILLAHIGSINKRTRLASEIYLHFRHRMAVIAPLINEQDRLEFFSQYARMKSVEDAITLAGNMQSILDQHKIEL